MARTEENPFGIFADDEGGIASKFDNCRTRDDARDLANGLIGEMAAGILGWLDRTAAATGMDASARKAMIGQYDTKIETGRAELLAYLDTLGRWPNPNVH